MEAALSCVPAAVTLVMITTAIGAAIKRNGRGAFRVSDKLFGNAHYHALQQLLVSYVIVRRIYGHLIILVTR